MNIPCIKNFIMNNELKTSCSKIFLSLITMCQGTHLSLVVLNLSPPILNWCCHYLYLRWVNTFPNYLSILLMILKISFLSFFPLLKQKKTKQNKTKAKQKKQTKIKTQQKPWIQKTYLIWNLFDMEHLIILWPHPCDFWGRNTRISLGLQDGTAMDMHNAKIMIWFSPNKVIVFM